MTLVKEAHATKRLSHAADAWKSLLVHVEPGKHVTARLDAAAALALDLDAELVGVGAESLEPVSFGDPYIGGTAQLFTELKEMAEANLDAAEKNFRAHAVGARIDWRRKDGRPAAVLARMARSSDLIVAGGERGVVGDPYRHADAAELALTSGRPVLVAPAVARRLRAKSVVVAWKDTREARRAVADALPILRCADEVLVVAVGDKLETLEFQSRAVADHLKRHGVKATAKAIVGSDDDPADALDREAETLGADLIVAGCYGRSRTTEWLFGGATRGLLRDPKRFLLISH